jgi:hypothetical protein
MNDDTRASNVVPILTEVVSGMEGGFLAGPGPAATPVEQGAGHASHEAGLLLDEETVIDQVVDCLDSQIDRMFEYRVREAIEPLLEVMAKEMVSRARDEISRTVRDLVKRAVHQEVLRRHRRE